MVSGKSVIKNKNLRVGERLCDDLSPRCGGRDRHQARQSQFPGNGITAHLKNGGTLEKALS
jgi:hypothetical protein